MKQGDAATHGGRAVIELREKILSGELPGGMRLFEVPTAELLDISRTPVREALSRLTEEGLLNRLPGGGFVVRRFGFADVVDAIEIRGVMEGTAARLAAERGASRGRLRRLATRYASWICASATVSMTSISIAIPRSIRCFTISLRRSAAAR